MDEMSQKPEQIQELYKSLCSSEQGTNTGTEGTTWGTGEEPRELQHPHSSARKGLGVSACGGAKHSVNPPGSCCCSGCAPHCAPGVAIHWPWAAPAAPGLGTAPKACSCHLPLSPALLGHPDPTAQPGPFPPIPEPSRSCSHSGNPWGESPEPLSCLLPLWLSKLHLSGEQLSHFLPTPSLSDGLQPCPESNKSFKDV